MTEPDVTLTDFALALECAAFVAVLCRRSAPPNQFRGWLLLYFAAAGAASFCGGLVHGYFLGADTIGRAIFWPLALTAIGVNTLAAASIGAWLLFSERTVQRLIPLAVTLLAVYTAIVLSGVNTFAVAIAVALPAALFLLVALLIARRRDGRPGAILAAAGIATTIAAAILQQLGIAADPEYFNHNATAHVVQAVALGLFFAGGLRLLDSNFADSHRSTSCLHDASS